MTRGRIMDYLLLRSSVFRDRCDSVFLWPPSFSEEERHVDL